jgi:hypothetical protein
MTTKKRLRYFEPQDQPGQGTGLPREQQRKLRMLAIIKAAAQRWRTSRGPHWTALHFKVLRYCKL